MIEGRRDPNQPDASMVARSDVVCGCNQGALACCLPTSHRCFVCNAPLCDACRDERLFKDSWVSICGCGEPACGYALQRRLYEEKEAIHGNA